jgi:hypothetical protein
MMNGQEYHATPGKTLRRKMAEEIRGSWQGRLLATATGKMGAVCLVMLAHTYYEAMDVLLRVVLPGVSITPPCLTGTARIAHTGKVMCSAIDENGIFNLGIPVFDSEDELTGEFRKIADKLKLTDDERVELFKAVQNWVTADYRIKPSVEHS